MIFRCRMSDLENKSVPPINHPYSPYPDSYRDYRDRETNKMNYKPRRKISFVIIIIIGLVIGIVIKKVKIGLIIGIVLWLMAGGLMSSKDDNK